MRCSPHLEQSKLTRQFDDVLLRIIFKSPKTEELTHRSNEWNLPSAEHWSLEFLPYLNQMQTIGVHESKNQLQKTRCLKAQHRLLSEKTSQVSSLACSSVIYFIWNDLLATETVWSQPNSPPLSSRVSGPLIYLSVLGSQGLLRQQARPDEEALPLELWFLLW